MSRYGTYDLEQGFIPDDDSPQQKTPKHTNGDKIRAMTDIEIAAWLASGCDPIPQDWCIKNYKSEGGCIQCWLDWLKLEVDDDE